MGLLQGEIVGLKAAKGELEVSRDLLVKAWALAPMTKCGPRARLCVRADPKAKAYGTVEESYRIIQGY